jgi:hypothetical protein
MEIRVRDDVIEVSVDGAKDWEYFYPHEIHRLDLHLPIKWVEKIKRFHKAYSTSDFDAPLAYIVFRNDNEEIVKVIAVSLFADEFNPATPQIVFIDIDEWLSGDP